MSRLFPFWPRVTAMMSAPAGPGGPADWNTLLNKPAAFPPASHNHDAAYAAAAHTHAGLPVLARLAADAAGNSSNVTFTSLFTVPVLAGEVWSVEAVIYFVSAAATTGLVLQLDTPGSPAFTQLVLDTQETAIAGRYVPSAANAALVGTAAVASPAVNVAYLTGTVENGANAGNLVLKYRSEVNASAVTAKRGSFARFTKH